MSKDPENLQHAVSYGYESTVIQIMKRWLLDAIVGVLSLIIFLAALLVIPAFIPGGDAYLVSLFLFIAVISGGGYLIRDITS